MKSFSKKSFGFMLAGVLAFGMSAIPFTSEAQSGCPNGCLDKIGSCYCYGTHAYEEAVWKEKL